MSELKIHGWTVAVETSYAGGKHSGTHVSVFTLGPRGGRRPVRIPADIGGLKDFARAIQDVAALAYEAEQGQLAQARLNGVLR